MDTTTLFVHLMTQRHLALLLVKEAHVRLQR